MIVSAEKLFIGGPSRSCFPHGPGPPGGNTFLPGTLAPALHQAKIGFSWVSRSFQVLASEAQGLLQFSGCPARDAAMPGSRLANRTTTCLVLGTPFSDDVLLKGTPHTPVIFDPKPPHTGCITLGFKSWHGLEIYGHLQLKT